MHSGTPVDDIECVLALVSVSAVYSIESYKEKDDAICITVDTEHHLQEDPLRIDNPLVPYSPRNINAVFYEILCIARFIVSSPDILALEQMILKEIGADLH